VVISAMARSHEQLSTIGGILKLSCLRDVVLYIRVLHFVLGCSTAVLLLCIRMVC
jgi:hypothetical protein